MNNLTIDLTNEKIKDIISYINDSVDNKLRRGQTSSVSTDEMRVENQILTVLCENPDYQPRECAQRVNNRYGLNLTGDDVIEHFRNMNLGNPHDRKDIIDWAASVANLFVMAMTGDRAAYDSFVEKRNEHVLKSGNHRMKEKIAMLMIYEKYPAIDTENNINDIFTLGATLGKYFFFDMSDAVAVAYDFPLANGKKQKKEKKKESDKPQQITLEQALAKIELLESTLDRTNSMLQELQDEFDNQLAENKTKELTDFFSQLNSEKYGYILDELLLAKRGIDTLKKNGFELPVELNGLLIMVRRLIQFVMDNHINPIERVNSVKKVKAADIEFCDYSGTPFTDINDEKTVRVVSPGWVYKDKEVRISRPKVREDK
jgi:hypothetical protein